VKGLYHIYLDCELSTDPPSGDHGVRCLRHAGAARLLEDPRGALARHTRRPGRIIAGLLAMYDSSAVLINAEMGRSVLRLGTRSNVSADSAIEGEAIRDRAV
jgi:hypothetical protein